MSLTKAFTTSKSQNWETPAHIYKKLEQDYGIKFTVDLCASKSNHLFPKYYTEIMDCRYQNWRTKDGEANFCNPPYGNNIIPDLAKLALRWATKHGANTVMLLPCNKTDQAWFHSCCVGKALILFVEKRISFMENGVSISGNPQGSVIICWGPAFDTDIGSFKQDKGIV